MYCLSDFDFHLPSRLIAQTPLLNRSSSRLLCVTSTTMLDYNFVDIVDLLSPGDLLIFNDTRVLKARLFGIKETGGKIEIFIEHIFNKYVVLAQIRSSHAPLPNTRLQLNYGGVKATVKNKHGQFYQLIFNADIYQYMEQYGHLPIPPYIKNQVNNFDEMRYQTIYAKTLGAVAAPTAGLHFDKMLLHKLKQKGINIAFVTLHISSGTFQPIRTQDLTKHQMHQEKYIISKDTVNCVKATRAIGGNIVAVGTTSMRALEAASQTQSLIAGDASTNLFITPGYVFKTVDRLITNFHFPKSTLLILISAFSGYSRIQAAYKHAISKNYRFFSYGDAMLLSRQIASI